MLYYIIDIHVLLFEFILVLNPQLKEQYYITQKWEKKWIDEGLNSVYSTYSDHYKIIADHSGHRELNIDNDGEDDDEGDLDELEKHILGEGRINNTEVNEIQDYLAVKRLSLKSQITPLIWWQV